MQLSNHSSRFAGLGTDFYTAVQPTPLPAPYWVGRSRAMARELGLADEWLQSDEALQALTGNAVLTHSQPLASVYSGHQFGVWAGQLGDGRALLLGETDTGFEVQLKGAGLTPYSRMGDGRAVLRSSIREFLCSEAMHALGIATTRALCVTGSDQPVRREEIETAAVVTRVAPSFIRFGHFEHFSYNNQHAQLKALADYVITRYYPACTSAPNPYAALLEAVAARTAKMVAQWQSVGFCHGVMNTDNMSILGLTIDYGPFQFMDAFDPAHVCNHSDEQGRYSFNRQPNIAYWNLFCLGQALLPLISAEGSQDEALAALEPYKTIYPSTLEAAMRAKLGLPDAQPDDKDLIEAVLKLMAQNKVDYSIFWRRLSHSVRTNDFEPTRDLFLDRQSFGQWLLQFSERLAPINAGLQADLMLKNNPKICAAQPFG
jgi:serine/tyrosine/threonine adenylyltransferase